MKSHREAEDKFNAFIFWLAVIIIIVVVLMAAVSCGTVIYLALKNWG